MKNDAARMAAVAKLDQAATRCTATAKSKGKSKHKNSQLAIRACLKKSV